MTKNISSASERIIPEEMDSPESFLVYLRHLFAYEFVGNYIPKDSLVIEVGSGEGYGANLLSKAGMKVIGLDVDSETIEHARQKYGSRNCSYKVYDGVQLPFENDSIDVVICLQVIEHVQDDRNFISQIWRVLKKEGIFMLTTPNGATRLTRTGRPLNRFHLREYRADELERLLKSFFPHVTLLGTRGKDYIEKIEQARTRRGQRIAALDPFRIRDIIPQKLKRTISKLPRAASFAASKQFSVGSARCQYSTKDFYVTEDDIDRSLDFLVVCYK